MHMETESPWSGIAHPDHREEDLEILLRGLRVTYLQINKLWVQLQSVPFFHRHFPSASLRELESVIAFLRSEPFTQGSLPHSELLQRLTQPESRPALRELICDLRCMRAIHTELFSRVSPAPGASLLPALTGYLAEACARLAAHERQIAEARGLNDAIAAVDARLARVRDLLARFNEASKETGYPAPRDSASARELFSVAEAARHAPEAALQWRSPFILAENQRVRIEAWQRRAKPLLVVQARLAEDFDLMQPITAQALRELIARIDAGGILHTFRAAHREALADARKLLKPGRELPENLVERLTEWQRFLEQKDAFESESELRALFGPLFNGIDTDFQGAFDANSWAIRLRREQLIPDAPMLGDAAIDYLFKASREQLLEIARRCTPERREELEALITSQPASQADSTDWTILESDLTRVHAELVRLRDILAHLGYKGELSLPRLSDTHQLSDELKFFFVRIEASIQALGLPRALVDSDAIEQVALYLHAVETSGLPEAVRASFASPLGPQRLTETNRMIIPAVALLRAVTEHLGHLQDATFGAVDPLLDLPVPMLLEKVQNAFKSPLLFAPHLAALRATTHADGAIPARLKGETEKKHSLEIPRGN